MKVDQEEDRKIGRPDKRRHRKHGSSKMKEADASQG